MHNVEEYRAWYSSRMAFQVSAGLRAAGRQHRLHPGQPAARGGRLAGQPTEDCARGRADVHAVRGQGGGRAQPRAGHPRRGAGAVFNKKVGSLFWQRVRWLQGIFQELVQGNWLDMPTLRQRLLAGYILATPILQAVSCALIPVAIAAVFLLKMPIGLTMFMFAPLIPMGLTIVSMLAGVRKFGRDYGQKVRLQALRLDLVPHAGVPGHPGHGGGGGRGQVPAPGQGLVQDGPDEPAPRGRRGAGRPVPAVGGMIDVDP